MTDEVFQDTEMIAEEIAEKVIKKLNVNGITLLEDENYQCTGRKFGCIESYTCSPPVSCSGSYECIGKVK